MKLQLYNETKQRRRIEKARKNNPAYVEALQLRLRQIELMNEIVEKAQTKRIEKHKVGIEKAQLQLL